MLEYYRSSNAKPRGSNLNEKIQTPISLTFQKRLSWLTYIDASKHTNKHKTYTNTKNTNSHISTPTNK